MRLWRRKVLTRDSRWRLARHPRRPPPLKDGTTLRPRAGRSILSRGSGFPVDFWLQSSYILARMRHEILLSPQALDDLKRLPADLRAFVKAGIEAFLRSEPEKISKSRIKR